MAQNPIVTFTMKGGDVIKAELYPEIAPTSVTSGRIGMHASCHGKHAFGMLQIIGETVLREFAADRIAWAAHAGSLRVSALYHKSFDNSVKNQSVVEIFLNQTDKVVDGCRCDFGI